MRTTTTITTRKRVAFLFAAATCILTLLFGRLAYVQVLRNDLYRERALLQRLRPVPVDAKRGTIYDRKGRELAVSISADSVYAVPAEISKLSKAEVDEVAETLARLLGLDKSDVHKKLTTRMATVWIQRKVPPEIAAKVRKAELPGIGITERSQRFYPKENLASHILGLAGIDNQGLEGIEVYYDSFLKGAPGKIVAERDGQGRQIPQGVSRYIPPQDGANIYLTIDEVIQYIAERELDRAMAATGSTKGVVIIMDPANGEILALANRPDYDPNAVNDYPASARRNTALADSYEPGSTFKTVTAAAALEEGVVKRDDEFDDPGYIIVEDRRLKCWKAGGHGHQTFVQAVENSCNPVFVKLATGLGRDKFYEYINAFGFGQKTRVDFPGEASGLLAEKESVGPVELATIGFGQGVSVTPLQIVNALSTIVNGGYLMRPHLVKEIVNPDGEVVKKIQTEMVRQVISKETSQELTDILASVVGNGSGKNAQVPGYRVGGKTGTAQIPDKGGYGNKVIASFMGFAPVDKPRIAAIVALYEPNTPITFGSVLAAPVFSAIAKDVLRYLGVKPTEKTSEAADQNTVQSEKLPAKVVVPDVRNLPVVDAIDTLEDNGLKGRYKGEGVIVYDQVPKPGLRMKRGATVVLDLDIPASKSRSGTKVTVPDLEGRTIKETAGILARIGLKLKFTGTGVAAEQIPAKGKRVSWGGVVEVKFKEPEIELQPTENREDGDSFDNIEVPEYSGNARPVVGDNISGLHP